MAHRATGVRGGGGGLFILCYDSWLKNTGCSQI
jgi:hypothetical protein